MVCDPRSKRTLTFLSGSEATLAGIFWTHNFDKLDPIVAQLTNCCNAQASWKWLPPHFKHLILPNLHLAASWVQPEHIVHILSTLPLAFDSNCFLVLSSAALSLGQLYNLLI